MTDIYAFLDAERIPYERFDHPPVYTVAEAERLVPPLPATHTKNLFLRDRKGERHFLVVVGFEKMVDLKGLARLLGVRKLGFGSPERLRRYLGVEPGAVSLLALVNDEAGAVEVVIDRPLWEARALACHPLVNTSTLTIARADMARFLRATGHSPRLVDVPGR